MKLGQRPVEICSGPLIPNLIRFSIPVMLSSMLQLFFNAADVIVVGRYAGATALAAVGSTGSLINLTINLFMGLSVGASVAVAQHYGARDAESVSRCVHTAMLTSILSGLFLTVFGLLFAHRFLALMDTPTDVIDQATLYLRIYFTGMPFMMVYNFGSAIMRSTGDTQRPLVFLTIAGVVNVVLNLIFVICFRMGVAGVGWATVISQAVSAVLVVIGLMRSTDSSRLFLRKLHIYKDMLLQMVRIGLPAGIQGAMFSISNVLIQSSVNSFGSTVMSANAAAGNIEGFVYNGMNAFYHAALTFAGQNVGAKKIERLPKIYSRCALLVTAIGLTLGLTSCIFAESLLSIYIPDLPQAIAYGKTRLWLISAPYFICGLMDVGVGMLRGMGKSVFPMLVSIMGVCVLRVGWIYTIFAQYHTLQLLYVSYPVSWLLTGSTHFICYLFVYRKMRIQAQLQGA